MKWLVAIMAVYMLALSSFPCGDSSDCSNEANTAISETMPTDHDEHRENCTPFCVCACCAVPVIQVGNAATVNSFIPLNIVKISYDETFYSSNIHNIWQPPRQFLL